MVQAKDDATHAGLGLGIESFTEMLSQGGLTCALTQRRAHSSSTLGCVELTVKPNQHICRPVEEGRRPDPLPRSPEGGRQRGQASSLSYHLWAQVWS